MEKGKKKKKKKKRTAGHECSEHQPSIANPAAKGDWGKKKRGGAQSIINLQRHYHWRAGQVARLRERKKRRKKRKKGELLQLQALNNAIPPIHFPGVPVHVVKRRGGGGGKRKKGGILAQARNG